MKTSSIAAFVIMASLSAASAEPPLPPPTGQVQSPNLLVNPGAEYGLLGWSRTGSPRAISYSQEGGYPDFATPGPEDRGQNFFAALAADPVLEAGLEASISQTIDLTFLNWVEFSGYTFHISGWLGGFVNQNDSAEISLSFLSENSTPNYYPVVGGTDFGLTYNCATPCSDADTTLDRGNITSFLFRELAGAVPFGAASATFEVIFNRTGGLSNDVYADNFSFVVVPEPSTAALLLGGAALAAIALRRRKR